MLYEVNDYALGYDRHMHYVCTYVIIVISVLVNSSSNRCCVGGGDNISHPFSLFKNNLGYIKIYSKFFRNVCCSAFTYEVNSSKSRFYLGILDTTS